MSRYTAVRAPFRFSFKTGHVDLCNACSAVLLHEGMLASRPTEEPLTLVGFKGMTLSPVTALCDGCEAAADLEAHSAVLRAPPARLAPDCGGTKQSRCIPGNEVWCDNHTSALMNAPIPF